MARWVKRWAVAATMQDGRIIIVRDFHILDNANAFGAILRNRDLYPGRDYKLSVMRIEVEVSGASNVNPAWRPSD